MIKFSTTIRPATLRDLRYIDDLSNKFSRELGFMPRIALENRINGTRAGSRWRACTYTRGPKGELWKLCRGCVAARVTSE